MHINNIHTKDYDFKGLITTYPELSEYVFRSIHNKETIDFSDPEAVIALNTAILKYYYELKHWSIPEGYLCPPIPSRVDYIHYIADVLKKEDYSEPINGLDIGVGANCIYPILGAKIYGWNMVGVDINTIAVSAAMANVENNQDIAKLIKIRYQKENANIFQGVIKSNEYFHFTMCNPPFYGSEEEAIKETKKKQKNLAFSTDGKRNFGGQANELWCNGGEALFLKRMIKQSVAFKTQVGFFTSLVSKNENIAKLYKLLKKLNASYEIISMQHGNKKTRFLVWKF